MNVRYLGQGQTARNDGTTTVTAGAAVGERARLILQPGWRVEVLGFRVPCLPLSSSSGASWSTFCCASQPLYPRTGGSGSTTGIPCRQRKLSRGSVASSKNKVASPRTQQENHGNAVTHVQDGCFLTLEIDSGHEIGTGRVHVVVSAEGETEHWWVRLLVAYKSEPTTGTPAGSRTALTDIDNRDDWTWTAPRTWMSRTV